MRAHAHAPTHLHTYIERETETERDREIESFSRVTHILLCYVFYFISFKVIFTLIKVPHPTTHNEPPRSAATLNTTTKKD